MKYFFGISSKTWRDIKDAGVHEQILFNTFAHASLQAKDTANKIGGQPVVLCVDTNTLNPVSLKQTSSGAIYEGSIGLKNLCL